MYSHYIQCLYLYLTMTLKKIILISQNFCMMRSQKTKTVHVPSGLESYCGNTILKMPGDPSEITAEKNRSQS